LWPGSAETFKRIQPHSLMAANLTEVFARKIPAIPFNRYSK